MKDSEFGDLSSAIGVVVLATLYGGVVLAIYPGWPEIWHFLNENLLLKKEAPAWAQAVVGAIAVCVALFLPWAERKRRTKETRENMVAACLVFAREACVALHNSHNKFVSPSRLLPVTSLERLKNIEKIGLVLAGKDIPSDMLVAVTQIMREISLAIQSTEDSRGKSYSEIMEWQNRSSIRLSKARVQRDAIKEKVH